MTRPPGFAKVVDRLGITGQLKLKTILVPGAQAAEIVAKREAEIGAAQTFLPAQVEHKKNSRCGAGTFAPVQLSTVTDRREVLTHFERALPANSPCALGPCGPGLS
jgi:hypothetical protein